MMGVVHGAFDHAELARLGLQPADVLDFSSNINPFGPPPGVREALAALDPAPYPDRNCVELRRILSERHQCEAEEILVGNGSNELIHLIARAMLGRGDCVLVIGPTFGEYAHASRLAGADVVEWQACAENGFAIDLQHLADLVYARKPRIVWLCDPNNPTGTALTIAEREALAELCAAHNCAVVIDHAYADMQRHGSPHMAAAGIQPCTLHLYSLTKMYALAGLRLGYLVANSALIRMIALYQPTWSVGSAAQVAGQATLRDLKFVQRTLPQLWQASDTLVDGLETLGLIVRRATLPFMLVHTGDGTKTRAALLNYRCLVRDCTSFGLPAYVRVAPRRLEENMHLLSVWRDVCQHQ